MNRHNKNYPIDEVVPFRDFKEMLSQATVLGGEKAGFRYKAGKEIVDVTYGQFENDTKCLGTALYKNGFCDKHIAMIGGNCYEYIVAFLTVLNTNGVFVPVDKELLFDEIIHVVNHSDTEVFFYTGAYYKNIHERSSEMPGVKKFILVGEKEKQPDELFTDYESIMSEGKEAFEAGETGYTDIEIDLLKMKLIVYTSGTTGTSKGVMLSTKNLVSCVYYGLQISTVYDTCLSVLPYHHTYESVCGILVSIHKAATICINESLRTVAANLKLYKPSYIMLVPAFVESFYKKIWANVEEQGKAKALKALIKVSNGLLKIGIDARKTLFKSIHEVFGGRMKKIVCGGAPIRAEIGDFFESIGVTLINGYGISECSPLVSANRDYFYDFVSVGVKLPCIEVKIDQPNEDGEGEICVKGDTVMLGYYKMPEQTAEVLDSETGWFRTGDYGKIDDMERLYITGRKKNIIVLRNGKNIYPEEIEDYIMSLQHIKEVIVSAVRDENGEETALQAEIFPDEEFSKENTSEAVYQNIKAQIEKLNVKLAKHKQVHHVKIRTTPFNHTTTGKIKRDYSKK